MCHGLRFSWRACSPTRSSHTGRCCSASCSRVIVLVSNDVCSHRGYCGDVERGHYKGKRCPPSGVLARALGVSRPERFVSRQSTLCPGKCPERSTLCPGKCPKRSTWCPERCPGQSTLRPGKCPERSTWCPGQSTWCPERCPGQSTSCPGQCPERSTWCPGRSTSCPGLSRATNDVPAILGGRQGRSPTSPVRGAWAPRRLVLVPQMRPHEGRGHQPWRSLQIRVKSSWHEALHVAALLPSSWCQLLALSAVCLQLQLVESSTYPMLSQHCQRSVNHSRTMQATLHMYCPRTDQTVGRLLDVCQSQELTGAGQPAMPYRWRPCANGYRWPHFWGLLLRR